MQGMDLAQSPGRFWCPMLLYGAFRTLFQGDHGGVEFATEGHQNLLRHYGLLDSSCRLMNRRPPSSGPWQALVIDDFFALSVEHTLTPPLKE